jgi:phosphoglycolate phosphatase-like HAD superfamily hydrolase
VLIFFDIDATMITTGGAGIRAMLAAGKELFGPGFTIEGIPVAGRLDPLIMNEMLERSGVPRTSDNLAVFRRRYAEHLPAQFDPARWRALPGVIALLDALKLDQSLAIGVLTGNFAETGALKLRHCGIDPARFHISVWGDESPHTPPARDHLPGVGLERYRARYGRPVPPQHVTIIGDTPHDIACAKAHNCRSLGVATGSFTPDQLAAAGADRIVPTLEATGDLVRWLTLA